MRTQPSSHIGDLIDELPHRRVRTGGAGERPVPGLHQQQAGLWHHQWRERADQLRADMAVWEQRFGSRVTLWYSYTLAEVADTSSTLASRPHSWA